MGQWHSTTKQGQFLNRVIARATSMVGQWCQKQLNFKSKRSGFKSFVSLFLVGISLSVAIASCGGGSNAPSGSTPGANSGTQGDVKVTLVSYAVTRAAYEKIIPQFTAKWKQEHNQNVTFTQSYGGSGSQSRAVIDGLEADIVALALELDIQKIEQAGLIQPGWQSEAPNNSIVTRSVAALVTREGNPQGIKGWEELAKPGVQVITANPKTSGGARWNFLGLWGSVTQTGGDQAKALDYTTKVFKNVPVLPRDAREASDVFFKQGQGNVLINYENEVILAALNGQKLPYVIPQVNISIDAPVTVVDKNVDKHGTREVSEAFVKFLFTPEAQREFAKVGFRSVDPTVEKEFAKEYVPIKKLFTAKDFGGWSDIQKNFFADGAIFDQILAKSGK
ncbi:sulfate ABC transporter substrate-binding protein [Aerosakkonemataceae cyanobacterium BLCC-F50]|uniref:Sulfate ABC transporter substrate-binding protein n=1 Tax=Floridaenema flaviceps BLCC-F50 TaxID=3153642 RepID=A0ABV4XW32_9CYAN